MPARAWLWASGHCDFKQAILLRPISIYKCKVFVELAAATIAKFSLLNSLYKHNLNAYGLNGSLSLTSAANFCQVYPGYPY